MIQPAATVAALTQADFDSCAAVMLTADPNGELAFLPSIVVVFLPEHPLHKNSAVIASGRAARLVTRDEADRQVAKWNQTGLTARPTTAAVQVHRRGAWDDTKTFAVRCEGTSYTGALNG